MHVLNNRVLLIGRELENEELCDDDLDTSRSMYEL